MWPPSAKLILSIFTFHNVLLPMHLPLEILICSLKGDRVVVIQESESEGKRVWEDTEEQALFISLVSQSKGRRSP